MPTYAYRCTACSHTFDMFQKFTDEPITECPECAAAVRKVFQPVGIVFKGSGWYINDSRTAEKNGAASAAKGDEKVTDKKDSAKSSPDSTSSKPESNSSTAGKTETGGQKTAATVKSAAD
ncbi:MAG: zinc ribbon domain-containing protein [Chloroflexia bacterium]|nr:zinc ribbon domain-containing protein [Chloroflexia bacterium]